MLPSAVSALLQQIAEVLIIGEGSFQHSAFSQEQKADR
jgi:hypothetical protein